MQQNRRDEFEAFGPGMRWVGFWDRGILDRGLAGDSLVGVWDRGFANVTLVYTFTTATTAYHSKKWGLVWWRFGAVEWGELPKFAFLPQ